MNDPFVIVYHDESFYLRTSAPFSTVRPREGNDGVCRSGRQLERFGSEQIAREHWEIQDAASCV